MSSSVEYYSAFFACSLNSGELPAAFSKSADHNAAPQVFVKAKKIPATGTISSNTALTPNLVAYVSCHILNN